MCASYSSAQGYAFWYNQRMQEWEACKRAAEMAAAPPRPVCEKSSADETAKRLRRLKRSSQKAICLSMVHEEEKEEDEGEDEEEATAQNQQKKEEARVEDATPAMTVCGGGEEGRAVVAVNGAGEFSPVLCISLQVVGALRKMGMDTSAIMERAIVTSTKSSEEDGTHAEAKSKVLLPPVRRRCLGAHEGSRFICFLGDLRRRGIDFREFVNPTLQENILKLGMEFIEEYRLEECVLKQAASERATAAAANGAAAMEPVDVRHVLIQVIASAYEFALCPEKEREDVFNRLSIKELHIQAERLMNLLEQNKVTRPDDRNGVECFQHELLEALRDYEEARRKWQISDMPHAICRCQEALHYLRNVVGDRVEGVDGYREHCANMVMLNIPNTVSLFGSMGEGQSESEHGARGMSVDLQAQVVHLMGRVAALKQQLVSLNQGDAAATTAMIERTLEHRQRRRAKAYLERSTYLLHRMEDAWSAYEGMLPELAIVNRRVQSARHTIREWLIAQEKRRLEKEKGASASQEEATKCMVKNEERLLKTSKNALEWERARRRRCLTEEEILFSDSFFVSETEDAAPTTTAAALVPGDATERKDETILFCHENMGDWSWLKNGKKRKEADR